MTAIMAVVLPDGLRFYSDGACYGDYGNVVLFKQKVDILMHLPALIATRGSGRSGSIFKVLMDQFNTFDEAILGAHELMLDSCREGFGLGDPVNLSLTIGGWSHQRDSWEAYSMWIHGTDPDDLMDGSLVMEPVEQLHIDPFPSSEALETAGLIKDGSLTMNIGTDHDPKAVMQALRNTEYPFGPGFNGSDADPDLAGCIVGGFIQKTGMTKDSAWTEIIHRWPDTLGYRMDPSHDEPLVRPA